MCAYPCVSSLRGQKLEYELPTVGAEFRTQVLYKSNMRLLRHSCSFFLLPFETGSHPTLGELALNLSVPQHFGYLVT